jgi:membrane protease subunit (stomatin/prohibitin family)
MGLFNQFANVVEWEPANENILFWKWKNDEIKKGSRLIVRPGQDAVFLYNGRVEGIFRDEGSYDIESQIIPFLSTLKGFKFGFNSGLRAEVMFINTREITEKWGTKNAINIPAPGLPGGMPIRSFGTFSCKVSDEQVLTDKVAGVQDVFTMDDIKIYMSRPSLFAIPNDVKIRFNDTDVVTGGTGYQRWWSREYERREALDL